MKVSVLLPTVGREAYLRTSLRSIANQTAREIIGEVVISDNRPTGVVEKIATEFPSLPIRIIRREPAIDINAHFKILPEDARCEFSAILHDDDWWSSVHLASALAALTATPSAVACYTAFAEVPAERSPIWADSSIGVWFGANCAALDQSWSLDLASVCIASLPGTFGRFSALVGRTEALCRAGYVYNLGNPFDTDRMLGIALALQGPVAYAPLSTAYIRRHPAQDGGRFSFSTLVGHMSDTTRWIIAQAREKNIELRAEISRRERACPPELVPQLARLWQQKWTRDVLQSEGLWPANFTAHLVPPNLSRTIGIRDFAPPILLSAVRSLRRRLGG